MLLAAYKCANTFIMPSVYEGTGLAAMEAALAGKRVIITENGGTRYYFGELAAYVNPRSEISIKKAISDVFGKPFNLELRNHMRLNFNKELTGKALEECYSFVNDLQN